jgi:hypothetical protein
MKLKLSIPLAAALVLLPAAALRAQMTGTSHPEELDDTKPTVPADGTHYVKPSPATPATTYTVTPPPAPVLYQHNPAPAPLQSATVAVDPTLNVTDDVNSGVVTSVPIGPNELPIGTHLKGTLQQPISTKTTAAGSRFTAALSTNVLRNGLVLLPAGSLVYGRITQIHGGRRISGPSSIRLQPDSVSLPNGTVDNFDDSHVNNEGTIVGNVHPGATAAAVGFTTTTAVVTGAVIGGGVGAVVGLGVGAGVAGVWWLKHDRQQELPSGTEIVFTLNTPLHINPAAH